MTESAYSIFKRPAPTKGQPFRKSVQAIPGVYVAQKHYSANIPQKINLAAFPWQLIADKGSFDGRKQWSEYGHSASRPRIEILRITRRARPTFRAALTERCFRYLDCFVDRLLTPREASVDNSQILRPIQKAVYLSSQLDRILGLNKAKEISSGTFSFTPCPVGVCRIDWVAQLTQTKQGGCLYKQPGSQEKQDGYNHRILVILRQWISRSVADLQGPCDWFRALGQVTNIVQSIYDAWRSKVSCTDNSWQKPGIGVLKSSKYNQNQALTPPVNLVGGTLMCEPYLPLVGPKPPYKGGSYAYN